MTWILTKLSGSHENTMEGQLIDKKRQILSKSISSLREKAMKGLFEVLPRWRGEIKSSILLLPPSEIIARMCMFEMEQLEQKMMKITSDIEKYDFEKWRDKTWI